MTGRELLAVLLGVLGVLGVLVLVAVSPHGHAAHTPKQQFATLCASTTAPGERPLPLVVYLVDC